MAKARRTSSGSVARDLSATDRAKLALELPKLEAPVFVCRDGAFVPYRRLHRLMEESWQSLNTTHVTCHEGLLLPLCREVDQLSSQPPLALRLNQHELYAIQMASASNVSAATIFGPPQEKPDNEDFAISALFQTPENKQCVFIAVADGVSTRTFWPQRASRLACFVALRLFQRHSLRGGGVSEADIRALKNELAEQLSAFLENDRRFLVQQKAIPVDWSEDTYRRNQKRLEYWYNSTLLICYVGPNGAALLWSGDGGISIEKMMKSKESSLSRPLESSSDLAVNNVVSLAGDIQLSAGRIAASVDFEEITATLVTDGVDRTRQNKMLICNLSESPDSETLRLKLEEMCSLNGAEVDNYSAAVVKWPLQHVASVSERRVFSLLCNMLIDG